MSAPAVVSRWSTAAPDPGDPGHLLPDDAWAAVVAGAERHEARGLRGLVDRTITARSHGGLMKAGPRMGVLHSAETPLRAGYAYSIAANWFATQANTSATVMIDPAETIRLLPDNVVAYHAGPKVNGWSVGVEQAGRAKMTAAEWSSADGLAQMRRVADYMVECWTRWGIPLRWATDAQIKAAAAGGPVAGWCCHDDVRRVLGGTTHTDPLPNYPRPALMALAVSRATPPPAPPARPKPRQTGDDAMIVASVLDPAKPKAVTYGVLSGGYLFGLANPGGADVAAAAGTLHVQWLTREDWGALDAISKARRAADAALARGGQA